MDLYNRQLHEDSKAKEQTLAKKLANESGGKYTEQQVEDHDDKMPLTQAIRFVMRVLTVWNPSAPTPTLLGIVSADEFSDVVKFHVKRLTEQWLSEIIEGYDDPVMSIELTEDITAALAALLK